MQNPKTLIMVSFDVDKALECSFFKDSHFKLIPIELIEDGFANWIN